LVFALEHATSNPMTTTAATVARGNRFMGSSRSGVGQW